MAAIVPTRFLLDTFSHLNDNVSQRNFEIEILIESIIRFINKKCELLFWEEMWIRL